MLVVAWSFKSGVFLYWCGFSYCCFAKSHLFSFKLLSNVNKETLIDAALKQKERTGSEVVVGNSINDNGMYEAYWVENQKAEKLDNKKAVANKIFKYIKRDNG
jgi:hypothetical protein